MQTVADGYKGSHTLVIDHTDGMEALQQLLMACFVILGNIISQLINLVTDGSR